MTSIGGQTVKTEEAAGRVSIHTGNTERIGVSQGGAISFGTGATVKWTTAVASASGAASLFTAGTGTTAVSGSSWDGVGSGTKYTVGDIVSALKSVGILGA